jgi:hypothetical protein
VPVEIAAAFITACGGQLGGGVWDIYTPEHWKAALAAKGFIIPEGRAGDFLYAVHWKGDSDTSYDWEIFGEGVPRSMYGMTDSHGNYMKTYLSRYGADGNVPASVPAAVTVSPDVMAKYLYD